MDMGGAKKIKVGIDISSVCFPILHVPRTHSFDSFLPKIDYSRGSTSDGSSELIFMFLESLEHVEWENTQSSFQFQLLIVLPPQVEPLPIFLQILIGIGIGKVKTFPAL